MDQIILQGYPVRSHFQIHNHVIFMTVILLLVRYRLFRTLPILDFVKIA